MFLCRTE